jgi:hypothetical protein
MRTARRRIALQSAGPLLQLDSPQSERGSPSGVEELGDAERIGEAGAALSFDLEDWTAFVEARRRRSRPPWDRRRPAGLLAKADLPPAARRSCGGALGVSG